MEVLIRMTREEAIEYSNPYEDSSDLFIERELEDSFEGISFSSSKYYATGRIKVLIVD